MSSYTFDKACVKAFLDQQLKLYPEKVAETDQEAREFLEDTMAIVCDNEKEVIEYLEDEMDITGLSKQEVLDQDEVFPVGDGRYIVVEG